MSKKKAFIVYATENYDLTKNFIEEFKLHNHDFELLHDENAYSNNINDQLIGYAKECDIALILTSPRLMNKGHYSNLNEIPILIDRRKNDEVIIIGVWLRDAEVKEWNKDADVTFFQQRFGEYRGSRNNSRYGNRDNNEFVIYELLDPIDRSTYHKRLKKWIDEVIKKKELAFLFM